MVWDFSEANALGGMAGDFLVSLSNMMRVLDHRTQFPGSVSQADAQTQKISTNKIISTDPPYYNNISYADLSDFFYIWLRRSLRSFLPSLFATMAVPKEEELVATPYRHGGEDKAEAFFLSGMTQAMKKLAEQAHLAFPATIYYAFKQSETDNDAGTASTGWETFLEAVNSAGFQLSGTWPMRTEMGNRQIAAGTNALASSIVLVCRKRPADAATVSRREFIRELNGALTRGARRNDQGLRDDRSPVAPVDLSQAIIGPGMAVFSKYAAVLEADGTPMSVKTALQLINRFLAEDEFDHDTQFCLHWFEQHGWNEGKFGDADTLARAKGTSVDGVKQAGVLFAVGGIVRLLKWADYPADWDPTTDQRLPVWEALHHLIRVFKTEGETGAGVFSAVQAKAEAAPAARVPSLYPMRACRMERGCPRLQRDYFKLERHRIRRCQGTRPIASKSVWLGRKEVMKPWREIAVPHCDVLEGTFQQSEFAADITAVHSGKAPREYQDAVAFF